MARPTTDPKPRILTIRLGLDDFRKLSRLAKQGKTSRADVLRRMLRAAKEGGAMGCVYNRGTKAKPNYWINWRDLAGKNCFQKIGEDKPLAKAGLQQKER